MLILIIAYFTFLILLSWKNFRFAIAWLILTIPTHLIRFQIGPIPSTLLEVSFLAIFFVWLIRFAKEDLTTITKTIKKYRLLFLLIFLFISAATIAAMANFLPLKALGIWRAYFLEPILFFLILIGRQKYISYKDLIKFIALSTISISVLAIFQKITGQFFAPSLWDDELGRRVFSFFTSPNAIGLYIAPIIALVFIFTSKNKLNKKYTDFHYTKFAILALALLAIVFSFSQGAWIALVAGFIVFIYFYGYKKIAILTILCGIILASSIPSLKSAVLFQDQAGQNRITLWSYSTKYVISKPSRFLIGSGLRRFFSEVQKPHYDHTKMERLLYPHNFFLNFWLETGLLGALSFTGILAYLFMLGFKTLKNNKQVGASILATLTIFIVHGLVDVPYFKNDLAIIFWLIVAIILLAHKKISDTKEENNTY